MRARILLGSLLALLVGAGFWFFVITPIIESTDEVEVAIQAELDTKASLTMQRNRLLRVKEAELQYIDAVGALEASIPPSPAQSELINALEALATESAVVWNGATFGMPTVNPEGGYNQIQLTVALTGQYFELLGYLYGMQELDRLIRVDAATFAPNVDEGRVELSVTIAATAFTTGDLATPGPGLPSDVAGERDGDDDTTGSDDSSAAPSTGG